MMGNKRDYTLYAMFTFYGPIIFNNHHCEIPECQPNAMKAYNGYPLRSYYNVYIVCSTCIADVHSICFNTYVLIKHVPHFSPILIITWDASRLCASIWHSKCETPCKKLRRKNFVQPGTLVLIDMFSTHIKRWQRPKEISLVELWLNGWWSHASTRPAPIHSRMGAKLTCMAFRCNLSIGFASDR